MLALASVALPHPPKLRCGLNVNLSKEKGEGQGEVKTRGQKDGTTHVHETSVIALSSSSLVHPDADEHAAAEHDDGEYDDDDDGHHHPATPQETLASIDS